MATCPDIFITRDLKVTYKELCELFHENPINGGNSTILKLKDEQLNRFRQFYDIDVHKYPKGNRYTIHSKFTKKEFEQQQKITLLKSTGGIVTINSQDYNLDNNKIYQQIGLNSYLLTILSNPNQHFTSKTQIVITAFYPMQFFQQLFIHYNPNLNYLYDKYGIPQLYYFTEFVYTKLYDLVNRRLKTFKENGLITIEEYYISNYQNTYTLPQVEQAEQHVLQRNGWTETGWMRDNPTVYNQYMNELNEELRRTHILSKYERITKKVTNFLPGVNLKDFTLLTPKEQIEFFDLFVKVFYEDIMYKLKIKRKFNTYADIADNFPNNKQNRIGLQPKLLDNKNGQQLNYNTAKWRYTIESIERLKEFFEFNINSYQNLDDVLREERYKSYDINRFKKYNELEIKSRSL